MKAWQILQRGGLQNLKWDNVEPQISKGKRIHILGAALNPADLKVLSGKDGGTFLHANRFPLQLGYDYSGTTESGQEVFGFLPYSTSNNQGSFSEYLFAPENEFAAKPKNLSHSQAASLATSALTALQGLRDKGKIRSGDSVLINGASGGVGSAAIQIAKILGARVTATASASKLDFVRSLGADVAIDYRETQPITWISKFDIVFDVASKTSFNPEILKPGGTYLTLLPSFAIVTGFLRSLVSSKRVRFVVVKSNRADLEQVAAWAEAGLLRPCVDSNFPMVDLPKALAHLATGKAKGKITISAI